MSRLLLVAAVWLSTAHAAAVVPAMMEPLLGKLRKGITNDIATIAEPIEKALFAIGFSQCEWVFTIYLKFKEVSSFTKTE